MSRHKLSGVTLLGIDTVHPLMTLRSQVYSMRMCDFEQVVLVTDSRRHQGEAHRAERLGIKVIHRPHIEGRGAYERDQLVNLPTWFSTPFVLFSEWDSSVVNPLDWSLSDPAYTTFDYIGAPWPYPYDEAGYPRCTAENSVGNGGFSLRSKRFC